MAMAEATAGPRSSPKICAAQDNAVKVLLATASGNTDVLKFILEDDCVHDHLKVKRNGAQEQAPVKNKNTEARSRHAAFDAAFEAGYQPCDESEKS